MYPPRVSKVRNTATTLIYSYLFSFFSVSFLLIATFIFCDDTRYAWKHFLIVSFFYYFSLAMHVPILVKFDRREIFTCFRLIVNTCFSVSILMYQYATVSSSSGGIVIMRCIRHTVRSIAPCRRTGKYIRRITKK